MTASVHAWRVWPLRALATAFVGGLVLLGGCASDPDLDQLVWHSIDPETDRIPYAVGPPAVTAGTEAADIRSAAAPTAEPAITQVAAAPVREEPEPVEAPPPPAEAHEAPLPVVRETELATDMGDPGGIVPPADSAGEEGDNGARALEERAALPLPEPTADSIPPAREPEAVRPVRVPPTPEPQPPALESDQEEIELPTWSDSVVARVNGAPILFSELKEFALDQSLSLAGLSIDGLRGESFRRAMTARVDQTLLVQAARQEELQADEVDVARRVDAFIAQRVDEAGGRAQFIQQLRGSQLDLESFRKLLIHRETRRQLASGVVSRRVTISTAELDSFSRERSEAGKPLEEVQLAQILIRCPSSEQETELGRDLFRRALELATRASRQPAAFSRILAEINADPTGRERGGLLGWLDPGSLQPAIREVVTTMRTGDVSPPIASDTGYHVLLLLDRRSARDMLFSEKFEAERNRLIEDLRSKAQIEIYPIDGAG